MRLFFRLSIVEADANDCYDIEWEAKEKENTVLTDCVDIDQGQHVFGGASNWYEYWPKTRPEQGQSDFDPFVSEDIFQGHNYTCVNNKPFSIHIISVVFKIFIVNTLTHVDMRCLVDKELE